MARIPVYDRQVGIRAGGPSPVNLPNQTTDLQMFQQGVNSLANAAVGMQRQQDDAQFQDASLNAKTSIQSIAENAQQLQGKNALGSTKAGLQEFDKQVSQLQAPQNRQDDWQRQVKAMRLQLGGMLNGHEMQQMDVYRDGQFKGQVDLGVQGAAQTWQDPVAYKLNNATTTHAIDAYGDAQGWSQEQTDAYKQDYTRRAAQSATEAQLAGIRQSMVNQDGTLNTFSGNVQPDQLFAGVISAESGGNQFDASGKPLVSGKGAVGVAQVMPGTAPEAARMAGLAWDESRYHNDPAYNAALGKAYLDAQLKKYDGNAVLAVAAYNAGPGAVDQWIQKYGDPRAGKITNEDFIRSIPYAETQNYVGNVLSRAPSTPQNGGLSAITNSAYFKQLNPQGQSAAIASYSSMLEQQRNQSKGVLNGVVNDASAALRSGQTPAMMPTREQLISTYGIVQGNQLATQLTNDQQFGHTVNLMKNASPADQLSVLDKWKPTATSSEDDRQNYQKLIGAMNQVNTQRKSDPVLFAQQNGRAQPIDFSDSDKLVSSIRQRESDMQAAGQDWQQPVQLFSQAEAKQLTNTLGQMPPEQAAQTLKTIGSGLDYKGVSMMSSQLGNQSPVYGAVSRMLNQPPVNNMADNRWFGTATKVDPNEAANAIMTGYKAIAPSDIDKKNGIQKMDLPPDAKLQTEFNNQVGNAFYGNSAAASQAFGVFKAAYAGILLTDPKKSVGNNSTAQTVVDSDVAEKAAGYATGGLSKSKIILPYGMDEDTFNARIATASDAAFKSAGLNNPSNFTPVRAPSGSYMFLAGGRFAVDPKTGVPISVNLNGSD